MIERMKFEKKENLKFCVRSGIIGFIEFIIACLFMLDNTKSSNFATGQEFFEDLIFVLLFCGGCLVITMLMIIIFKAKKEKNIKEFYYNARVDEFLEFLGNREIELKLRLELDAPSGFEETILDHKCTYYVRKEGPESLYICARKKGDEIWHCTTKNDDEFLFEYFEPIYGIRKEE